jgi:DNA (cytosine-5)-methyltransferase 1
VTASTEIRVGSLFSGTGALDTAALAVLGERARIVWHADIKPAAAALLAARDPGVPNLGDIHGIDAHSPAVDALTFGWPCQPHSSAGKRLGEADPRALWPEVARIIAALRPRHLFGENVARVASNGELARVVRALAQLGYLGTYRTLRASDIGAPHRRDRLFLYAVDADRLDDATADAERGGLAQHPQRDGRALGGEDGARGLDAVRRGACGSTELTLLPTPAARNWNGIDRRDRPAGAGSLDLQTVAELIPPRWGQYAPAIARWKHITGHGAPEPTVPSAKAVTGRVLSPRFVEWMMGLPPGWVELPELSRSQQLSLLGDGVVPQQAIAAFTELTARMHVSRETATAASAS